MNADRLLALYEMVSEAPDAIPRLRRFVLDLAVRGKLVPQEASDEPALELLQRIAAEETRLVKAGEIRKSRKEAELSSEDPHELPDNWIWVPFGELHYLVRGVTYSKGDVSDSASTGFVPILRANNIGPTLTHDDPVYVKSERVSPDQYLRRGDYMIALSSGSKNLVGKAALVPDDLDRAFGGFCGAVRLFDPSLVGFVGVFLSSDLYRDSISAGSRGIGINNLKKEVLANLHFPLPPLAEQRRIVAKVEELMALLDRLEAARTARETTRDRLTAASLARLTAPDADPAEFPANARFALATLPALTTRPDQIKPLRQTILNLAVRGKLVEQDPTDEPASELLTRIAVERSHLIDAGEIGKQKPVPAIDETEVPFALPDRWTWCRLGSLVLASDAGWSPRTENHAREGDAWGVLKVSAVSWDYFDPEANKQVLPRTEPRLQAQVHKGDFLISRANTAELVARAVLVLDEPRNLMMSDKIVRLRLATECDHRFAWLVNNNANYAREHYASNATGVSPSMKNVSRAVILNLPIPLPPLAEQHRIVAKVDALMALCDRLEAALTTADTTRARLLEALLYEALEPTAEAVTEAAE